MRELLIVYGTTEGQTRKIAEFLAGEAREHGYGCAVYDATLAPADLDLARFTKVIIAASVHMERHQTAVTHFVREHRAALQKIPSAFLSVSLSAAGHAEECYDAWAYTRQFLSETDWQPPQVHVVAGALRFSEHDFFKRWAMKRLAKEKRAERNEDHEYTDWAELSRFIKDFLGPKF